MAEDKANEILRAAFMKKKRLDIDQMLGILKDAGFDMGAILKVVDAKDAFLKEGLIKPHIKTDAEIRQWHGLEGLSWDLVEAD